MCTVQVSDQLTELKLGNGTSILITANIASALPNSVGAAVQSAASKDQSNLAVYGLALFLTTLGVVYVQARPPSTCTMLSHSQRQTRRLPELSCLTGSKPRPLSLVPDH